MKRKRCCKDRIEKNWRLVSWWQIIKSNGQYCDTTNNYSELRNKNYKTHLASSAHHRRSIDVLRETMIWMQTHSNDHLVGEINKSRVRNEDKARREEIQAIIDFQIKYHPSASQIYNLVQNSKNL